MLRVISSDRSDPIVRALTELGNCGFKVDVLTVNDIIEADHLTVETSANEPRIVFEPSSRKARTANCWYSVGTPVLNRILSFPESLFTRFDPEDRDYARRELEAFIGGLISIIQSPFCPPGTPVGLTWLQPSLPEQWERVRANPACRAAVKTPEYLWLGPLASRTKIEETYHQDWIQKEPHDFAKWRNDFDENRASTARKALLMHSRPAGAPRFVLILDGIPTSWDGPEEFVESLALEIARELSLENGEMLFFKDESGWTFGSATAAISHCCKDWERFKRTVEIRFSKYSSGIHS